MRLLDVFHTVVGKRTPQCHRDDYFACTAGEPRPRPSAPGCIHGVAAHASSFRHQPNGTPFSGQSATAYRATVDGELVEIALPAWESERSELPAQQPTCGPGATVAPTG